MHEGYSVCHWILFDREPIEYRRSSVGYVLYRGPDGLAQGIAKVFTEKTGIKVDVYQATSGDVLARLEAEKGKPRADVVVLASWGEGLAVRDRGLVTPYSSPEAENYGLEGLTAASRHKGEPPSP